MTSPDVERRHTISIGSYTPGIALMEQVVEAEFKAHDSAYNAANDGRWIPDYHLLDHSYMLETVLKKMGEARGADARQIALRRSSAFVHDVGKLDQACEIYRLNRELTDDERRVVAKHQQISGDYVLSWTGLVRSEDHAYLEDLYAVVSDHHTPERIKNGALREIGVDLNVADMFIALMEKRHKPGLSQFQALAKIESIVEEKILHLRIAPFASEFRSSLDLLKSFYGQDSVLALDPNAAL